MTLEPCEFLKISARDFKKMKQVVNTQLPTECSVFISNTFCQEESRLHVTFGNMLILDFLACRQQNNEPELRTDAIMSTV